MSNKARILFVDDEMRVLKSMRGLFRREFELFLTTEGEDAVKITTENAIDVVVADQRMPGMSGTELLGKVKKLSPKTVRILLTGYADPEAVEGSINIGEVFRFLSKPCSPKVLRDTLKLAVAASRTRLQSTPLTPRPITHAKTVSHPRELPILVEAAASLRQQNGVQQRSPVRSPALLPRQPNVTQARNVTPRPVARVVRPSSPVRSPALTRPQSSINQARKDTPRPVAPVVRPITPPLELNASSSHWRTTTNVVLSGDTSQEFEVPNFDSYQGDKNYQDVGVVFFTVDPNFVETAMRAASTDRNVTLATSLANVARAIEREDAGVLVTDVTTNCAVLQRMITTLKQQLPTLVTIVASASRDTTNMINLINHGQVYRYILKPIESRSLMFEIDAAAIKHLELIRNPELAMRHQVADLTTDEDDDTSDTLNNFIARIRELRSGSHIARERLV